MNNHRLENLEIKLAFQEKAIKDLNDVLYEQQKEIDRLTSLVEALMKERADRETPGPANEKPPHY
ncbi:MAG: SlyX family protein [Desulfobacterales bacterium]|nr:SlyX family protein [Desulfobacterales bacterium]